MSNEFHKIVLTKIKKKTFENRISKYCEKIMMPNNYCLSMLVETLFSQPDLLREATKIILLQHEEKRYLNKAAENLGIDSYERKYIKP